MAQLSGTLTTQRIQSLNGTCLVDFFYLGVEDRHRWYLSDVESKVLESKSGNHSFCLRKVMVVYLTSGGRRSVVVVRSSKTTFYSSVFIYYSLLSGLN